MKINNSFIYLLSEALYAKTLNNPSSNRNWLFSIYKALLVSNELNNDPIIWTKYNQWKIDHNCRAAKSNIDRNKVRLNGYDLRKIDDDNYEIIASVTKDENKADLFINYKRRGYINDLWEFKNPNGDSVLKSINERDELFNSTLI